MSDDTPFNEPPAWEYRPHALIVLPGVSWEEWTTLWSAIERSHKSVAFWVGDALNIGSSSFGERFSQVVDPKYIHQQRGPMWVCSRIEPGRRKSNCSYSLHREIASLEPKEQDKWLELASEGSWTVKDLKEEIEAEKARARQSNSPPVANEEDEMPPGSTWNGDSTFDSAEDIAGEPFQLNGHDATAPEAGEGAADTPQPEPTTSASPSAEEIRSCIAAVRKIANDIVMGNASGSAIDQVEHAVFVCAFQDATALGCLTDHERALDLIPKPWRGKISIEFGEHVFGGRAYSVDLRKPGGKQMAAGHGPSLTCAIVESVLSALLSDMGLDGHAAAA